MKKLTAGLVAVVVSLVMPLSMALADEVVNNLDVSIDAAPESATITSGGSINVGYFINPTNGPAHGEGVNGCNVDASHSATLTITPPANVTVNGGSSAQLTYTTCNTTQSVSFSSSTPATYNLNGGGAYSMSGGLTGSSWIVNTASFHLVVLPPNAPPDVTPPVITPTVDGTLGNNGWYVSDVQVSWSVSDDESAISSSTGCDTVLVTADTTGTTYTCQATSAGGTSSQSVTIKRDATAPEISLVSTYTNEADYVQGTWTNEDVSANFLCEDATSGPVSANDIEVLSTEGANQGITGNCQDLAGNTSSDSTSVTDVDIDKTAPTASAVALPAPNVNGWNNTDVTVSFQGSDALSGIASCSPDVVLSAEAAGQSASGTCTDNAGNVSDTATADNINIDKTNPGITITTPAGGAAYTLNQAVTASYACTDALSGVASCVGNVANGAVVATNVSGLYHFTVNATDNADNHSSATNDYSVGYHAFGGFNTPLSIASKDFKKTSTIPVKFQLFDFFGNPYSGAVATLNVCTGTVLTCSVPAKPSGSSNTGNLFRYDPSAKQYIYNLSTKSLGAIGSNTLILTLDGTTQAPVIFMIK